nr:hypothetical protein [Tanacetum cinerariifolium]
MSQMPWSQMIHCFVSVPTRYFWILTNKTVAKELVEAVPPTIPCLFEYTRFYDLCKYADSDSYHIFSSKEQGTEIVTRRNLVIVEEEKKLLLMTLWNQFDDKEGNTLAGMIGSGPMIFDMRLKVTTFNCLSLTTTRGMSGFMINPPVSPDLQMQPWYNLQICDMIS